MATWEFNSLKVDLLAVVAGIYAFFPGFVTVYKLFGIVYLVDIKMERMTTSLCAIIF